MRKRSWIAPSLALAALAVVAPSFVRAEGAGGSCRRSAKKVTLCHVPPGQPVTISVGEAAVSAHLRHGDSLGACPTGCQGDPAACDDRNACASDSRADGADNDCDGLIDLQDPDCVPPDPGPD